MLGVTPDHLVEPMFYYSTGRYKRAYEASLNDMLADEAILNAVKGQSFLAVDLSFDSISHKYTAGLRGDGAVIQHVHELINDLLTKKDEKEYYNKRAKDLFGKLKDPANTDTLEVKLTTSDNIIIAKAVRDPNDKTGKGYKIVPVQGKGRSVNFIDNSPSYDITDPASIRKVIEETMARVPEDKQDVKRCFPTFRLRIIDFDSGLYSDEFYEYNSVRSIHIFHDKYAASTAELEITNVTGILDNDRFFTDQEEVDFGLPPDEEERTTIEPQKGRYFRAIKLKEGTCIQILMGYDPDPDRLETVFTGRISQLEMGDIVRIIASGYKTELQNEVSFHNEDKSMMDVVTRVFKHLDGEGYLKDDDEKPPDERKNGTPHLGSRLSMASDKQRRSYNRIMRTLFSPEKLVYGSAAWKHQTAIGLSLPDTAIPELTLDGRGYVDLFSGKPSRYRNIMMKSFTSDTLDDWVAEFEPGYDVLQELTRFMPGWICDVVPYDHLATVYIGPPEGEYFWTAKFNRQIVSRYRNWEPNQDLVERNKRITDMMERFSYHWHAWCRSKAGLIGTSERFEHKQGSTKLDWLPPDVKYGNIQNIVDGIKRRSTKIYDAFIGAFFGFDLITQADYPASISRSLKKVIDMLVTADTRIVASALKIDLLGANYEDINIHIRQSVTRQVENFTNNTPGFKQKMYQLSQFGTGRIQEVVGKLAFGMNSRYVQKMVRMDDIRGITAAERLQADSTMSKRDLINRNLFNNDERTLEQYFEDEQGKQSGLDLNVFNLGSTFLDMAWYEIPLYPPRNFEDDFGLLVRRSLLDLKAYIYRLHIFLNEELSDEDVAQMGSDIAEYQAGFKMPDKRPFRQYHHVTSRYDIIENNIVASMKEMANAVLIRHPDGKPTITEVENPTGGDVPSSVFIDKAETDWTTFKSPDGIPFHPNLKLEQKKLAMAVEKNATTQELAALTFFSRMGEALRPMYRGNLIMWGRAIKPHDVILIADDYNEMRGPIDTERVIHHFTPQTGWITQVIPHAFVHVDNSIEIFQVSVAQQLWSAAEFILDVVDYGLLIAAIVTGGFAIAGKGVTSAIRAGAKKMIEVAIGRSIRSKAERTAIRTGARMWKRRLFSLGSRGSATGGAFGAGAKPLRFGLAPEIGLKGTGAQARKAAAYKLRRERLEILRAGYDSPSKRALFNRKGGFQRFASPEEHIMHITGNSGNQIAKEAGQSVKHQLRSLFRGSAVWGGATVGSAIAGATASHLAVSAMSKIPGMVSITPLIYDGRPLVAGLDYDDKYYISQAEGIWKGFKDRSEDFIEQFGDRIEGAAKWATNAPEEDNDAMNPVSVHGR